VRRAVRSLTRISDSLDAALPVEHVDPLLEGLRTPEPPRIRDAPQRLVRAGAMTDEPGADDDARSPASGPAVDVHQTAGVELGVDLVQRRDECIPRGNREVADRTVDVAGRWLHVRGVRLELAGLREIQEQRDPRCRQLAHLGRRILRSPRAGVPPRDEAAGLDDRRPAHDGEVCRLRYPVRGDGLKRHLTGADSRGMERLDTSAAELSERALVLVHEQGVDPGTWYVRVLEEGRREGLEPDLGALVRVYWELQRVTGRADLRDTWRLLAERFWGTQDEAVG
jgi:hypothetical protein